MENRPRILSAAFVRNVKTPGRYGDGRGSYGLSLFVRETKNGRISKTWSQRIRINGRLTNIGLGNYPILGLSEAREKCVANRRAVERGEDPRRSAVVPTFAKATEKYIAIHAPGWRDPQTAKMWRSQLARYAGRLADRRVDEIATGELIEVLEPIWHDRPSLGVKIRQRIDSIMKWAIAEGYRGDNPADALDGVLPKQNGKKSKHQKALHHSKVAESIAKLRGSGAWLGTVLAYEFAAATCARVGEVRFATWDEIDLDGRLWVVPADRTKTQREYRVPLSSMALGVLERAEDIRDATGLLFPTVRGLVMHDGTLTNLLKKLDIGGTTHGLRSSFRDWAAENGVDDKVAEFCLSHLNSDRTEAAYLRTDMIEARREALQAWADYLAG